ncbi:hypothetical protein KIN20_019044 [Parelaphostrongylus tenuis]|uniref:Uncharacterized protein n=1 Tax=Parelaphostrongylus tenuis TaxID=148309 RepID=A0AAD5N4D0_PARTN|nr:hypothetical protein KIN20_019044 [Parelaphostrongylus tenuis]
MPEYGTRNYFNARGQKKNARNQNVACNVTSILIKSVSTSSTSSAMSPYASLSHKSRSSRWFILGVSKYANSP